MSANNYLLGKGSARKLRVLTTAIAVSVAMGLLGSQAYAAATISIVNANAPGIGFNDTTPAAPVGGNTGTTIGAQRLNAFQAAAQRWGSTLTSSVTIVVRAQFTSLDCDASSAVLGSAGPTSVFRDFANAPFATTWYHSALADRLAQSDLGPGQPDIAANFNSDLGQPDCLAGSPFYLGLDGNHGDAIDLVTVLLHEFGHGLGFSTVTNGSTGQFLNGVPSSYDRFLFDNSTGRLWSAMTSNQRRTSAVNARRLAWNGSRVTASVPDVLNSGTPFLNITSPTSIDGRYLVGAASFGPALTGGTGTSGEIVRITDSGTLGLACTALSAANAAKVSGKIALLDRGTCTFPIKVKNAQNAGAIGVIIADNVAGSPPPDLGGSDPTITIPSVRITQANGTSIKNVLAGRRNNRVFGNLALDTSIFAGADASGRALVYTPNPFQGGSSVSHFDTSTSPNQLMEPAINDDLSHSLVPPEDLTYRLLQDLGW
jgi:hypothetical protein